MVKFIKQRLSKLQNSLTTNQSILLSKNSDIFYFSSFVNSVPQERSAFLLVSQTASYLLLQNFLPIPQDFPGKVLLGTNPDKLTKHLEQLEKELNLKEISIDLSNINVEEFQAISKVNTLKINTLDKQKIWQLRSQKDHLELKKIKMAQKITRQAIALTIRELKVGMTELEIKKKLENQIRQHADCDLAFQSIVAFGQNSTLPHHQATNKKLINGSVVLIDAGAKYQEYCADMTRTVFFKQQKQQTKQIKQKEKEFKKILNLVKKAQHQAKILLKSAEDITVADLDLACRNYIAKAGFARNFIHTTGHGLGIDIHEPPSIYKTNSTKLMTNMALTIEPGIYLEGKFGVRWEDTVFRLI